MTVALPGQVRSISLWAGAPPEHWWPAMGHFLTAPLPGGGGGGRARAHCRFRNRGTAVPNMFVNLV